MSGDSRERRRQAPHPSQVLDIESFLSEAAQYQLGKLVTEAQHPDTLSLATQARENPKLALATIHAIDAAALDKVLARREEIIAMGRAMAETFASGKRVILCGCGATGRLVLSLEYLWRKNAPEARRDQVRAFMAGGDSALIRSIEGFEDYPEYGARQLEEIGFQAGDLLISCTEGGETPFVIGATWHALTVSPTGPLPFFLYCNPDTALNDIERARAVIADRRIRRINLTVGPMVLSGSTRLQACTVMMAAVGAALFGNGDPDRTAEHLTEITGVVRTADFSFLTDFVRLESQIYNNSGLITYTTNDYGMPIVTDTTERSPTFSLQGFENTHDQTISPALCYLALPHARTVDDAWHSLLGRAPRPLEWEEAREKSGAHRVSGYDFSATAIERRKKLAAPNIQHEFTILRRDSRMTFQLRPLYHETDISDVSDLAQHILLKALLNAHSTLVMGRLGRYEANVMTWVRPSNRKLVDRAIRYVQLLRHAQELTPLPYAEIAFEMFEVIPNLQDSDPVVLRTLERLGRKAG